jgi:hypothetical protein
MHALFDREREIFGITTGVGQSRNNSMFGIGILRSNLFEAFGAQDDAGSDETSDELSISDEKISERATQL